MPHLHAKHKKIYKSFGQFLSKHRLCPDSTSEITAYREFVMAKRNERGCIRNSALRYLEKHHIVPQSFGGKNHSHNYVYLTSHEHMWAHVLFKRAILSTKNFGKHLKNKTQSTAPSMKVILREWLQPSKPIRLLEYYSYQTY